MAISLLWTNFTAGLIDELLDGRVDVSKYNNGVHTLKNFIPFQQGGLKARAGSRYVAAAKYSDRHAILLPFRFNVTQQYVLEVGDLYIRFFTNSGRLEVASVPVEIASPYSQFEISQIKHTQSADVMYMTHENHWPQQLSRISATEFILSDFAADPPPTVENGDVAHTGNLTLASGSGASVGVTSTQNDFLQGDIGRRITGKGGKAAIIGFGAANSIQVQITTTFTDTTLSNGEWELLDSPFATLTPAAGALHEIVNLSLGTAGWRAADVGRYVRSNNGGYWRITAFNNATSVSAEILVIPPTLGPFTGGTWSIESVAWSATRGYPRTVCLADQRLWFDGGPSEPDTLYGSNVGLYDKFARGPNDSDSVKLVLASKEVDAVYWLEATRNLIAGTAGSEHKIYATNDGPLTPDDINSRPTTDNGSESIMPCRAGGDIIFVQRGGQKIRAIKYTYENDSYPAEDLTLLSCDIGYPRILQIAYEKIPVPIIWSIRSDGILLSLTYDPDQEVFAWAMQVTAPTKAGAGVYRSVCPILHPDGTRTQTWVLVERNIAQSTVRYIEWFDQATQMKGRHPLLLDSGLTYSGSPVTTISNLDHLEGETVGVVVDGAAHPNRTVSGGEITLDASASEVDVGLIYIPEVESLRPAMQLSNGNIVFLTKGYSHLKVLFNNTVGAEINGDQMEWRSSADLTDEAVPSKTEIIEKINLGWDQDGRWRIRQTQPLPIIIVAVQGEVEIGEK